jgi:hypothetical protein
LNEFEHNLFQSKTLSTGGKMGSVNKSEKKEKEKGN